MAGDKAKSPDPVAAMPGRSGRMRELRAPGHR